MKIGFIGSGNMAEAIISGMVSSNNFLGKDINISSRNKETLEYMSGKYSINKYVTNKELVDKSDIIIIAVKPDMYGLVLEEVKKQIKGKIIVNIAAGIKISYIESIIGKEKIFRLMPNTPAMVGEGMTSISFNECVNEEDIKEVSKIFKSIGKVEIVDEKLIHAVIGVSGSSPAYVYMFIEALADAAVMEGMKRDKAYKFAAQAVLGSAKMVLETKLHPGVLKDNVCSPNGTTIKAVGTLEEEGFRSAIIKAVNSCIIKSKEME